MSDCETYRELTWALPDELTEEEALRLAAHLEECADCRSEAEGRAAVSAALAFAPDEEAPGEEALEQVRARLNLSAPAAFAPEVLTPEDVAAMFSVPVEDVFENLDELPAFEFAGRVRFRRSAILAWMEEQEARWRRQSQTARVRDVARGRD